MCSLGCRVRIQELCGLRELNKVFGGNPNKMSARIKTESVRFCLKKPQTIEDCLRFLRLVGALIRIGGFQVKYLDRSFARLGYLLVGSVYERKGLRYFRIRPSNTIRPAK